MRCKHLGFVYCDNCDPDHIYDFKFSSPIKKITSKFKKVNPMVLKYGELGGVTCKNCKHLERHCGGNKIYPKCRLRGISHGAGTDHLVNWEACKKYAV
jgi:hypothetical protein